MSSGAILCVDDEMLILNALKEQLLRLFGGQFEYEFAQSAEDAWNVIEELKDEGIQILIVISDWLMPNMKGDEFLIKVHQLFPEVITIILTGQADEEAIERVKDRANLYACLTKPWTEEDLRQVVRQGLGR